MKSNTRARVHTLTVSAMIAALYVGLTALSNALGLVVGPFQIRLSEALCLLPVLTPAAVPGVFVGCLISNLLSFVSPWDLIFGSLATLLGALGTYFLRRHPVPASLCPVLSNTLILPPVLSLVIDGTLSPALLGFYGVTVAVGELLSASLLGLLLIYALRPYRERLFGPIDK